MAESDSETKSPKLSKPGILKKKRNANFNRDEMICLVTEYGKKLNVLNFGNREQKQKCWEEITAEINSLHGIFHRTIEEVKKKWIDLLYATKKEYIKATKDAAAAGESQRRKLSEISEMIVKVRGGFSNKRGKIKNENNGVHIISLEIPNTEGSDQPATIYIPHVDECHSEASDGGSVTGNQGTVLVSEGNYSNVHVNSNDNTILQTVETYEYDSAAAPPSPSQPYQCSCGLSADIIRLKQETLGVLRRTIQIEEERRIEEKQKWWEEKQIMRLKKQKLELEIKQLQMKHSTIVQTSTSS